MVFTLYKRTFGKLLVICLVLIMIDTNQLLAQKFSLGAKAGPLALVSVYGDKEYGETIDNKTKFGFYAAGIISFPLKNNYACVIEGGYSQKGRSVTFNNGSSANNATYKYIDAALLLRKSFKFYLGKDVPADWFINVGPHISYWLGGNGSIGSSLNNGTSYNIEFADTFRLGDFNTMYMIDANRWLFGADIGVGMEAPITKTQRIMVELRFTWGHTYYGGSTTANYDWIEFTDNNMKANEKVLSLTVAYMFDIDLKENKKGRSTKDSEIKRKYGNNKKVKRRR